MNFTAFGPLIGSLIRTGSPAISTALQIGIGEIPIVGGIAGPLVGMTAPRIVQAIAEKLGAPPDATPDQLAAKIDADPDAAKAALSSLEEQHSFTLARQKEADSLAIASQAQQVSIDTVEAQNPSVFVAGWRPLLGWSLGALVMLSFALPYFVWIARMAGLSPPPPPALDPQAVLILSGLLGLTVAARSVDKFAGNDAPSLGGTSRTVTTRRVGR